MRSYFGIGIAAMSVFVLFAVGAMAKFGLIDNPNWDVSYGIDLSKVLAGLGLYVFFCVFGFSLARFWYRRRIDVTESYGLRLHETEHSEFLDKLDHELKGPLTTINLAVGNLTHEYGAKCSNSSLENISAQSLRLHRLIQGLRALANLRGSDVERSKVEIEEVLTEAVTLSSNSFEGKERVIRLDVENIPWPVSPVMGDPDMLLNAFRNLIDNAIKFSRDGDQIAIRVREENLMATVEIADTGPGIPSEELPYIFDELFRGQDARVTEGSGIGLSLVRQIVRLHDGDVNVRSREGPDKKGTVVTIRIPIV